MIQQTQYELRINARELNYEDLDFPECAESLRGYIERNISTEIHSVVLDIRWCVVIYSQANVFLDCCLSKLANNAASSKKLIILTTDNYITRALTCYELFRTTLAANATAHDPKLVVAAIDEYCVNNNLSIEVQVFSGDTEDPNSPVLDSYEFPERGI